MRMGLVVMMAALLWRPEITMAAARDALQLFAAAVLPGLFPYMVLSLMLASRCGAGMPFAAAALLGWGGGSPTGARLLAYAGGSRKRQVCLAVTCATMSPMFLLGTLGDWLGSRRAGVMTLLAVLASGAVTGAAAGSCCRGEKAAATPPPAEPLTLGRAVETATVTMLTVAGSVVMLRVLAAFAAMVLPGRWGLAACTVLEVTTGTAALAALPLPLPLRTALCAGAAGFGGAAVMLQNRSLYPPGLMRWPVQCLWQAVHGTLAFLTALGLMLLCP